MSELSYFRAKNAMLFACVVSNAVGAAVIIFISRGMGEIFSPEMMPLAFRITLLFVPFAFCLPIISTLIYEKPIRRYLNRLRDQKPTTEDALLKARKKLLKSWRVRIGKRLNKIAAREVIHSSMTWRAIAPAFSAEAIPASSPTRNTESQACGTDSGKRGSEDAARNGIPRTGSGGGIACGGSMVCQAVISDWFAAAKPPDRYRRSAPRPA